MEHVEPLMGIILPYANFFIFLALAIYFFRKPAAAAAAKKRTEFERLMNEARAARDAANAKLEELQRRQAGLDREIAEIKAMSKASAELEATKIVSDAERVAEHLRHEAKRIADAEVQKARASLRQEIMTAVQDAVTKKIKAELNPEAQLSLVRTKIGELKTIRAEG